MMNLIIIALETAMLLICLSLSDDGGEALVAFLTGHFFAMVILGISILVIKIGGM